MNSLPDARRTGLLDVWPRTGWRLEEPQLLRDGPLGTLYRVRATPVGPRPGRRALRAAGAVLKLARLGTARAGLVVEASVLAGLARHGLAAPRPLALRRSGGWGGLLMTELVGAPATADPAAYRELGRALARLHHGAPPACGPGAAGPRLDPAGWLALRLSWVRKALEGRPGAAALLAAAGGARLQTLKAGVSQLPPAWTHGDPGPHNLLTTAAGPVLVDFAQAHRFVAEADLALVLARLISPRHPAARRVAEAIACVAAYREAGGRLSASFRSRIDAYLILHWLETAVGLVGQLPPGDDAWHHEVLPAIHARLRGHSDGTMGELLGSTAAGSLLGGE